jgi:hypothetical protein
VCVAGSRADNPQRQHRGRGVCRVPAAA